MPSRSRAASPTGGRATSPAAYRHYEAAEREARGLGDEAEIANALYNRFFAPAPTASVDQWSRALAYDGLPLAREALAINERLGDPGGIARCLWAVGMGYLYGEDLEKLGAAGAQPRGRRVRAARRLVRPGVGAVHARGDQ